MKRKVLYIEGNVDGTIGGSYYVMIDLVKALDKMQYEPIVGFHTDNSLIPMLKEAGIETHVFDNPAPFSFTIPALNFILLPVKKTINLFKKLLLPALRYARFIRHNNIDLVNGNNSIMLNQTWMLAAMLTKTRCITHEMGINTRFSFLSRYLGKRLGAIICVSNVVRDNMVRLGLEFPNIRVVHNGLDLSRYHIVETPSELRSKYNIGDTDPIIGVVGNIRVWKGQEIIVRAMSELVEKHSNIRCLLVGASSLTDAPYKGKLISICKDLDIEDNVIFTGFQNNPIDYMNLMDIVVHTSVEPEPFGIVLLEAMFLAKPLISTTIGGPAEIVVNGESGLLVEPGKPELLAEAVDKLLSNPIYAKEIGQHGNRRLHEEFTIQENAEKTMIIYDEVFGQRVT